VSPGVHATLSRFQRKMRPRGSDGSVRSGVVGYVHERPCLLYLYVDIQRSDRAIEMYA
jgi:hypothetical protein